MMELGESFKDALRSRGQSFPKEDYCLFKTLKRKLICPCPYKKHIHK